MDRLPGAHGSEVLLPGVRSRRQLGPGSGPTVEPPEDRYRDDVLAQPGKYVEAIDLPGTLDGCVSHQRCRKVGPGRPLRRRGRYGFCLYRPGPFRHEGAGPGRGLLEIVRHWRERRLTNAQLEIDR